MPVASITLPHHAAQGVDLADDLPLGDAADGRVAAHLADGVADSWSAGRPCPHPRAAKAAFGPGVPRAPITTTSKS